MDKFNPSYVPELCRYCGQRIGYSEHIVSQTRPTVYKKLRFKSKILYVHKSCYEKEHGVKVK